MTLVVTALLFLLFRQDQDRPGDASGGQQPESSKLVGIPTRWILAGSWGLAGALAALAGVLYAGAQAPGHADADVHGVRLRLGVGDARRPRQPDRCRRRRPRDRCRREPRRRVLPRVDRPGDEAVGRRDVHLRRAARQARPACSAPPRWSGCELDEPVGRDGDAGAHPPELARPLGDPRPCGCAATVLFVLYIPTQHRGRHDRRHDARLPAGDGGDGAQPGDGLRRDRLARPLGVTSASAATRRPSSSTTTAGRQGWTCTSPPSSGSWSAA